MEFDAKEVEEERDRPEHEGKKVWLRGKFVDKGVMKWHGNYGENGDYWERRTKRRHIYNEKDQEWYPEHRCIEKDEDDHFLYYLSSWNLARWPSRDSDDGGGSEGYLTANED